MKQYIVLLVVALTSVVLCHPRPADDHYTDKYDNIDLDEILNNERLYKSYFKCLMGEGKCTPDGKEVKEVIPEALSNKCAKCNEKQQSRTEQVFKFVIHNKPEDWKRMEAKYDPEGKYKKMYKEDLEKRGIKVP